MIYLHKKFFILDLKLMASRDGDAGVM